MKTIKEGDVLTTTSICDHNCVYTVTVLKRNKSFVTVLTMLGERRVKVRQDPRGDEYIFAHGQHSMCPVFRAK